jgi:formate dehydrogenase subunit gamma
MTTRLLSFVAALGVAALVAACAFAFEAHAQQQSPASVDPSASVQTEQRLLDELHRIQGRGSIPDTKSYVIEQPAGRTWQIFHQTYLRWVGAAAIICIFSLLVIFYLWRGTLRFGARAGRMMLRFTAFERFVHWMTATCFTVLAISGLNITFGRPLLLPLIGPETFATWSQWAKYAHNYLSFPFTLGVILMFFVWVASNLPTRADVEWIKEGGGMFGGEEPPAYKFNAGEKFIFWTVVIGGSVVTVTGYVLLFPFYLSGIAGMQAAQVVHSVVGVLYIAAMLVHIYMGTLGMEGALEGMWGGEVDVNWAKSHHLLWYEEEVGGKAVDRSRASLDTKAIKTG